MNALEELQQAVATTAEKIGPSVVAVGRGAGMVVGTDRVLTNAHNLTAETMSVRFADGRTADANVTAADVDGDLAVVTVETGDAPPVTWADARPPLGGAVLALGAPRRGPARVTVGFVSADRRRFRGPRGRRLEGIEHTAPVGRGSSGGPVVDTAGNVVAIDTHRAGDGFTIALPVDEVLRNRIEALARGEVPVRRRLGIAVAPAEVARRLRAAVGLDDRAGVLVREVEEDAAGARAGLRGGDLIVAVGDRAITRPDDLLDALDGGDDALTLGIVRGEQDLTLEVTFDA